MWIPTTLSKTILTRIFLYRLSLPNSKVLSLTLSHRWFRPKRFLMRNWKIFRKSPKEATGRLYCPRFKIPLIFSKLGYPNAFPRLNTSYLTTKDSVKKQANGLRQITHWPISDSTQLMMMKMKIKIVEIIKIITVLMTMQSIKSGNSYSSSFMTLFERNS